MKVMELAAGELSDRFSSVGAQSVARGKERHSGQPHRRSKLTDAVKHLRAVMVLILGVSSFVAEAAVRRAGLVALELRRLVRDCGTRARKSEAVHGSVCIAEEAQSLVEGCPAALIDSFAEQQNGAPVLRRLRPQLLDGHHEAVQNGGARIARVQISELIGSVISIGRKGQEEMRSTVKTDDGDAVLNVADERVEDGIELTVVAEVTCSSASCFNNDSQREGLRIRVLNKREMLQELRRR